MTLRSRLAVVGGFALWTLLVWGSRIRNIWDDGDLSTAGQVGRTLLALSFVAVGVVLAVLVVRARRRPFAAGERLVVLGAAVWTTGVWVVRGGQILAGDHSAGFVVVHTVLAVVSIAWAGWACRASRWATVGRSPVPAGRR